MSRTSTYRLYDNTLQQLLQAFGDVDYQHLRIPLAEHRRRIAQQIEPFSHYVRHLHIDVTSSAPDSQSSHRLSLRALLALAHEADGKGFAGPQADQWRSSTAAYVSAAFLPRASYLRTITISISGFLHSESRELLLEVVSRLHALGTIAFRFQLDGLREEDVLFGRRAIDKSILEQCLSRRLGYRIVVSDHDLVASPPPAIARAGLAC